MRTGIRLSGAGGHGIITAAVVLADGAARSGNNVCQTQAYGPEARGGTAHADLLISDGPLLHPKITTADLLVVLTQEASDSFSRFVAQGGTIIADGGVVVGANGCRVVSLPLLLTARASSGGEAHAGIVAAGAVSALTELIDMAGVEAAISARLPPHTIAANLASFSAGRALMREALGAPAQEPYEADL